jgi:hypothetical protein
VSSWETLLGLVQNLPKLQKYFMNFNTYNLIAEKLSIDYLTFNLKNGRNKIEEIKLKKSQKNLIMLTKSILTW